MPAVELSHGQADTELVLARPAIWLQVARVTGPARPGPAQAACEPAQEL